MYEYLNFIEETGTLGSFGTLCYLTVHMVITKHNIINKYSRLLIRHF